MSEEAPYADPARLIQRFFPIVPGEGAPVYDTSLS
jgi:hypothetical protein